jgi:hypothetical protein
LSKYGNFLREKIRELYTIQFTKVDIAEIKTGMAEKSSLGTRQTDDKNLVWFGKIEN